MRNKTIWIGALIGFLLYLSYGVGWYVVIYGIGIQEGFLFIWSAILIRSLLIGGLGGLLIGFIISEIKGKDEK